MSSPAQFLMALGQSWAAVGLYAEGHPARVRAIQGAADALEELLEAPRRIEFSFLGGEVIQGNRILRDLRSWEWAARLAGIGVERLEFVAPVTIPDLNQFVLLVFQELSLGEAGPGLEPSQPATGIRYGRLSIGGESLTDLARLAIATTVEYDLAPEIAAVRWVQEQATTANRLPVVETETIVRSLALAMRQQGELMLPLLELQGLDEYAITHSCNVAVLSMGLAEYLGHAPREVRAIGVAAMLADLGNVRLPRELLLKEGALTAAERELIERHCVEGATMILTRHARMELAAVVAYEHHLDLDGGGYPVMAFPREPHFASRLVRICDCYDAAMSRRSWREPLGSEESLRMLEAGAGTRFDPDLVGPFATMLRQARVRRVAFDRPVVEVEAVEEVAAVSGER